MFLLIYLFGKGYGNWRVKKNYYGDNCVVYKIIPGQPNTYLIKNTSYE